MLHDWILQISHYSCPIRCVVVACASRVIKIRNRLLIMNAHYGSAGDRYWSALKLPPPGATRDGHRLISTQTINYVSPLPRPPHCPRCLSVSKSVADVCHLAYMAVDHVGNVHVSAAAARPIYIYAPGFQCTIQFLFVLFPIIQYPLFVFSLKLGRV